MLRTLGTHQGPLGIPHASHDAHTCTSTCTTQAHTQTQLLNSCIVLMLTWFNTLACCLSLFAFFFIVVFALFQVVLPLFGTNLNLIKFYGLFVLFCICFLVLCPFVQMSRCSSCGKDPVIGLTSSPVSKRTRHLFEVSNSERFKSPLHFQTFSSIFQDAPTMVERIVQFDTLGSTFIPRIFADNDWTDLFGNFKDLSDRLIKERYSNTRLIGVEL